MELGGEKFIVNFKAERAKASEELITYSE